MKTYDLAELTKKTYESGLDFFNLKTLGDILEITTERSLYNVIKKLVMAGIITKIERNKYLLNKAIDNEFKVANFIYEPSYISFESALSYYGILSQFPVEVTSATTKSSRQKKFNGKIYGFYKIDKKYFWGYEKKDGLLIAEPEKAFLDQAYLSFKGLKKLNFDELNMDVLDMEKLRKYANIYQSGVKKLIKL